MRFDRDIIKYVQEARRALQKPDNVDALYKAGGVAAVVAAAGSLALAGTEAGIATVLPKGKIRNDLLESAGNHVGRGVLVGLLGVGALLHRSSSSPESAAPQVPAPSEPERELPQVVRQAMLMRDIEQRIGGGIR